MNNPNGPSQEQIDDWNDELHSQHERESFVEDKSYLENRLALCRLREQRCIDKLNWHEATKANGWYWLAGALGGLDERYHGGNSQPAKSPEECLRIFAEHARVSLTVARELADKIGRLWSTKGNAKQEFHAWIEAQSPRWQAESDNARKLLATL